MTTKRKSEFAKSRTLMSHAIRRMVITLPMVARVNWRTIVMPWRLIPMPIGLALIALVALAMVLDTGSDAIANVDPAEGQGVMVGGDTVAPGTRCQEDEIITYRALLGGTGVGCVHYEYLIMDFIGECMIGNAEHGDNLASYHLRDQSFRSWCGDVVDDASDGMMALSDVLMETGATSAAAITPTPTITATPTTTATPIPPSALPATGSH